MSDLGEGIVEDLLNYKKEAWCRALFKGHSKCDVVEINMCKTFNYWILGSRFISFITMLEGIRVKVMKRMNQMREFTERWITDVSLMTVKILRENDFEFIDPPYNLILMSKVRCVVVGHGN